MLTMREVSEQGFGYKATEWDKVTLLKEWREHWGSVVKVVEKAEKRQDPAS